MDSVLSLTQLFKSAASCCEKHLQGALEEMNLSPCQASVLLQVETQVKTMSEVSRALYCHKSNITQIVEALKERGLVDQIPSKKDRRVVHLGLTQRGHKLLDSARAAMMKSSVKCLSIYTPREKKMLMVLLKRYVDNHA